MVETYKNEKLNRYASIVGSVMVYLVGAVLAVLIGTQAIYTKMLRIVRTHRRN